MVQEAALEQMVLEAVLEQMVQEAVMEQMVLKPKSVKLLGILSIPRGCSQ